MSNLIFPAPVVQKWGIVWPIKKSPSFKTLVQTPANNRGEVRISLTQFPIWVWDLDVNYLKGDMSSGSVSSAFQQIIGFFGEMQGAASDWLYQDPYDNSCVGQILGYGDGTTQQFQLVRNTGGMTDLMQAAVPTNVYINNTPIPAGPQTSGAQWYCGIENQLLYSQTFQNAVWVAGSTTVVDNAQVAPDGSTTAATLAFASHGTDTYVGIGQTVTVATALPATVTFSVWLKAAATQTAEITVGNGNPATGTSWSNSFLCSVTTSWTRFQVSISIPVLAGNQVMVQIRSPYAPSESGFTVYAWGAQLERWASASGYNPTTSAQSFPNGIVTFAAAPAAGTTITADFSFYYRCRFLDDQWVDLTEDLYQVWSQKSLKFKSLLL